MVSLRNIKRRTPFVLKVRWTVLEVDCGLCGLIDLGGSDVLLGRHNENGTPIPNSMGGRSSFLSRRHSVLSFFYSKRMDDLASLIGLPDNQVSMCCKLTFLNILLLLTQI